jgi:ABC-type multidrug transport system ATPase subunit
MTPPRRVIIVIQVIAYHKSYRDSVAVDGLTFNVQPGKVLGLLGPNGACTNQPPSLFDQPLTGLDPHGIRQMKASVRDEAASGAAVIISSHLLGLVQDLCTDLLILHCGKTIHFGPVANARAAIGSDADASLEEVFFRATENASG